MTWFQKRVRIVGLHRSHRAQFGWIGQGDGGLNGDHEYTTDQEKDAEKDSYDLPPKQSIPLIVIDKSVKEARDIEGTKV